MALLFGELEARDILVGRLSKKKAAPERSGLDRPCSAALELQAAFLPAS
jgi:hypothetical protein